MERIFLVTLFTYRKPHNGNLEVTSSNLIGVFDNEGYADDLIDEIIDKARSKFLVEVSERFREDTNDIEISLERACDDGGKLTLIKQMFDSNTRLDINNIDIDSLEYMPW